MKTVRILSDETMRLMIAAAKDEASRPKVERIRRRPNNPILYGNRRIRVSR